MPGIPAPFLSVLHRALTTVTDEPSLQTLSVLLFGTAEGFRSKVRNVVFGDQVAEYLRVLDREGKLLAFVERFLENERGNTRPEITELKEAFKAMFIAKADGSLGLSPKLFNVVKIGAASPFIARGRFQKHLRKVMNRENFARNVIILGGGSRCGHSYLGEYLAELSDRYDLFVTVKIDFLTDVPKDKDGGISALRLAHKLAGVIPGLEHYRSMYLKRPADFKLSTFQDDLATALQRSDQLYLFFFDHLNKVALDEELQDLIVDLADRVARPGTRGMVVFSGLKMRPSDNISGRPQTINLQPISRDQVKAFLGTFYQLTSAVKSEEKKAEGRAFLRMALDEVFPSELFSEDPPCGIAEIGNLLTDVIEAYLEATEEDEEQIVADDVLNLFGP